MADCADATLLPLDSGTLHALAALIAVAPWTLVAAPASYASLLHHLNCCLLTCSRLADLQVPRTQVHMAVHLPIDTQRNFNTGCAYLIVHDCR